MANVRQSLVLAAAIATAVPSILFFEWHTDEPTVVLPVLVVVSFVAGLMVPPRFLLIGLCLGWSILVAHLLSALTGMLVPRYQTAAPSMGDWAVMTMLVVPALGAAFGGSRAAAGIGFNMTG
jgi:hypothetical protein